MIFAAGAVFSLLLGTAAISQDAPPAPPVEAAPAAATPQVQETPAATPVAEAKGKIIFFRPGRLPGAVYTYYVVETGDDGKPAKDAPRLGGLPNGGAFILEVEPGIHNYNITGPMAVNKAEDRIRLEVEAGETYYIEQTFRMGMVTSGFKLVPADEARFTASKADLDKGKK